VSTVVLDGHVRIPDWVNDLASFRRWADSDDLPEKLHIWYLGGEIWVFVRPEPIFTHNQVTLEFTCVLGGLVKKARLGHYYVWGLFWSNLDADIAGMPDAMFFSADSLNSGRVRLLRGKDGEYNEVQGSPDMVLEVVSPNSVEKDTVLLRRGYWEAGVREYWLVNARKDSLQFDILRHTTKGYRATPKQGGWVKSSVFGKSFRLTQAKDRLGHPEYTLAVR
jgi:hypothetical protein